MRAMVVRAGQLTAHERLLGAQAPSTWAPGEAVRPTRRVHLAEVIRNISDPPGVFMS
jgi:hypothetical protein